MEFYSNSRPSLINPDMKQAVYKIMKNKADSRTVSDKISDSISVFYKNYIMPNKIATLVIVSVIVFLISRFYSNKKNKENIEEEWETFADSKIFDEIMNEQTAHLRYDTQPTFDRLQSVVKQAEPVNYYPNPIPVNVPNQGFIDGNSMYPYSQQTSTMNSPDYNYNNVYQNPSLSMYTGTYNPYETSLGPSIPNPLGFRTDFNETTGNFVKGMTNANQQNITDYQTIIDNMQGNLIDALKTGPKYLDTGIPEFEMEPPYSDVI